MPARVKAAASATNPFRFGRIVSGDAFTDREADLLALERELRGGQNVLIEAPRRFGKTSLILEVKRHLEAAGIPVAYLDCMLVPSRARLADRLASAYLDAFKSPAQRAEDWVVQHLKAFRVRPTLTLDSEGHASLSFEAGSAGTPNLDALLEQIFQEPEVIAREGKKKRVVVILDEFQDLMELGVTLLRQLRAVIQHQQHVSYAFLGSRQALLRRAVHERNAPLLKMARPYPLGPLPREEFACHVVLPAIGPLHTAFEAAHRMRFGYVRDAAAEIEITAARVELVRAEAPPVLPIRAAGPMPGARRRDRVWSGGAKPAGNFRRAGESDAQPHDAPRDAAPGQLALVAGVGARSAPGQRVAPLQKPPGRRGPSAQGIRREGRPVVQFPRRPR